MLRITNKTESLNTMERQNAIVTKQRLGFVRFVQHFFSSLSSSSS